MTAPSPVFDSVLASDLSLGPVELSVSDLPRSLRYYTEAIGLKLLSEGVGEATLGVPGRPLLVLRELRGAPFAPVSSPGLYHFALLLPTRADLGRFVRHYAGMGLRLGQGDHLVSEAFYTNDPDGHGIEIYRDRPRADWSWQGSQVQMATDPVDVNSLLAEPGAELPFTGLPDGARLGHVHLRVRDIAATRRFYGDVLGLDVVADLSSALFMSVGGYHHHLGLNTWHSAGGAAAPEGSARLLGFDLTLPKKADLDALEARLQAAQYPFEVQGGVLSLQDPSGNRLRFSAS